MLTGILYHIHLQISRRDTHVLHPNPRKLLRRPYRHDHDRQSVHDLKNLWPAPTARNGQHLRLKHACHSRVSAGFFFPQNDGPFILGGYSTTDNIEIRNDGDETCSTYHKARTGAFFRKKMHISCSPFLTAIY